MENESGQAGADTEELEITSEMRQAGADALDDARGCLSQREAAEAVYRAMDQRRRDELLTRRCPS